MSGPIGGCVPAGILRVRADVLPGQPQLVSVRLEAAHERVHADADHVIPADTGRGAVSRRYGRYGHTRRTLGDGTATAAGCGVER